MHQTQTDHCQCQCHLLNIILLLLFILNCSVTYLVALLIPLLPVRVLGCTLLHLHQHIHQRQCQRTLRTFDLLCLHPRYLRLQTEMEAISGQNIGCLPRVYFLPEMFLYRLLPRPLTEQEAQIRPHVNNTQMEDPERLEPSSSRLFRVKVLGMP